MLRFIPRRVSVWVAVVCLAVMLIALGAAAKHSQFVGPAHNTSYLAQSVKMVSGDHADAGSLPVFPVILAEPPRVTATVSVPCRATRSFAAAPRSTPLLV